MADAVRVRNSTDQTISNDTLTVLNFDTEDYDTNAMHDNVTNNSRLTCKTAGKYWISANISFAEETTGFRQIRINLNGTNTIAMSSIRAADPILSSLMVGTDYDLAVDDYVEVQVWQNSGGSLAAHATGSTHPYSPVFAMHQF